MSLNWKVKRSSTESNYSRQGQYLRKCKISLLRWIVSEISKAILWPVEYWRQISSVLEQRKLRECWIGQTWPFYWSLTIQLDLNNATGFILLLLKICIYTVAIILVLKPYMTNHRYDEGKLLVEGGGGYGIQTPIRDWTWPISLTFGIERMTGKEWGRVVIGKIRVPIGSHTESRMPAKHPETGL